MTEDDRKDYLSVPYLYKDKDIILTREGYVYDGKVIKSVKATDEEIEKFNVSLKEKISEKKMIKEIVQEEPLEKEIISDVIQEASVVIEEEASVKKKK